MSTENLQTMISRRTSKRLLAIGFVGAIALSGLTACSSASTEIEPSAASTPSQVAEEAEQEVTESTEPIIEREPTRVAMSFADGITSEEVLEWIDAATGQMLNPPTDFMGLVWPIGMALDEEPDPQVFDGDPFMEHSDVLGDDELDEVAAYFRNWQAGLEGCDPEDARGFDEGAARVERWIKGGANVATAPDPCF